MSLRVSPLPRWGTQFGTPNRTHPCRWGTFARCVAFSAILDTWRIAPAELLDVAFKPHELRKLGVEMCSL